MKEGRNRFNSISAGSMADIAFLLLIFFLVATQIPKEEGVSTTLPGYGKATSNEPMEDLNVWLNASDQIMIEGEMTTLDQSPLVIYQRLRPDPSRIRVNIRSHEGASYDAYVKVYGAIKKAYKLAYENEAQKLYGKSFEELSGQEKQIIQNNAPMKVLEGDLVYDN